MPTLEFIALVAIGLITIGAGLTILALDAQETNAQETDAPDSRPVLGLVMAANLLIASLLLLDVI